MKPYSSQCFVRATRGSRHRCLGALATLLSTRLKLHDAGAPVAEGHLGVKRHLALFHTPVTQHVLRGLGWDSLKGGHVWENLHPKSIFAAGSCCVCNMKAPTGLLEISARVVSKP